MQHWNVRSLTQQMTRTVVIVLESCLRFTLKFCYELIWNGRFYLRFVYKKRKIENKIIVISRGAPRMRGPGLLT